MMEKKLRWILICSALLGFSIHLQRPKERDSSPGFNLTPWIKEHHQRLRQRYPDPEHADFLLSTTLGEKRWLNPRTKKLHQKFNLTHLFTPSGLHFGALVLLIRPFVSSPLWRSLFYLAPLTLAGFHSCKRVGLILASKSLFKGRELYPLFLLIMALDYAFGSYRHSPLSFLYSFTFLGIFIVSGESSKFSLIFNLFVANIILAFFSGGAISPWSIFMGFALTWLFCLFFPLLFLSVFIPPLAFLTGPLIAKWFQLLEGTPSPEFFVSASVPLILVLIFQRQLTPLLVGGLLMIHCEPLKQRSAKERFLTERVLPAHAVSKVVPKKYGLQVDSERWGLRCRYELVRDEWRASCRDLPAWKKRQKLVANESS